jgi:hypothetical protein
MKQTVLMILLLGFGSILPATCSKTSKEASKQEDKSRKHSEPKHIVLYGPVVKVATQSKA